MIYLNRRVSLSMAHRLHNPAFSDEENRALYGKCNHPSGHGHEYILEVTVAGEIDPTSGFSCSLPQIDEVLAREITARFDHLDFNRDTGVYASIISSGENLARLFFDLIAPHFPPEAPLVRVRIEETEKNSFEYFGETPRHPDAPARLKASR